MKLFKRIAQYAIYRFFTRKIVMYKWQLNLFSLIIFTAGIGFSLFILTEKIILPSIFAATTPWTQTDWSGGVSAAVATGTVTTYESVSNTDASTTIGQATLTQTSGWAGSYTSWAKRQVITITNGGALQTDYQVKLVVTYDVDMQADFDDLRFTNSAGTALNYWIQDKTDSSTATVWVKVDSLGAVGDTTIYMYYGNSAASASSSGSDTFMFFDDFSSGSIDATKWDLLGTASSYFSVISGELQVGEGNSGWDKSFASDTTFARADISMDIKYRWTSNNASYDAMMFGWHDSGVGASYTDLVYGYYNTSSNTCTTCGAIVYEDGGVRSPVTESWTQNTQYLTRVRMRSGGGAYYEQSSDGGDTWATSYTSSYSTESNLKIGIALYSGVHVFDDIRVRKWMTTEPTSAFGTEVSEYPSSGTLTSNIFNAEFSADWGTLTYSTSGTGAVSVKVRTDSSSDMSGATAWGSCTAISSGADMSSNSCVTDTDQYLQYQVTLTPSGASTPVFEDISIAFGASDQIVPPTNASSLDITGLADTDTWTSTEPTITWTGGADDLSGGGLAGYCIALDEVTVTGSETSTSLNPATTAGSLLNTIDDGITNNSSCGYIVSGTSVNLSSISGLTLTTGKRYYLSIKAVDLAGNVYTGASGTYQDLVDFKYDSTAPTNVSYISAPSTVFGNVADMSFSWPSTGGAISSDANSGVAGWQYSLDSGSTWRGPDTNSTLGITYVENDSATYSYTLTEGDDGADISAGINTVYFRTVDTAGNYSSAATYRTAPLNYGGAAPTFATGCDLTSGITITPATSTSNSFALSWEVATATGGNTVSSYYYMINTSPPSTLASLQSNSTQYIVNTTTSLSARALTGSIKGSNTVYVVAIDSADNYSQSNCVKGTFTLNSTLPDPARFLSASDASIKSDELWRASITWTVPSYAGTGTLTYVIQRSEDNSTWTEVTTTTGTAYTDTVTTSQTYYYRVGTYDTTSESIAAPTYTTSVSVYPKGTWSAAPSLSGDPTVSKITTKKATITWSTSRASDSKIQYGTSAGSYFDEEPSKSDQVTAHELNLTNLTSGTKYYYKVKWTDEDGNTGSSSESTFTTDAAPVAKGVLVSNIGLANVFVNYTVTGATKVVIYYGISTSFGGSKEISTSTSETSYSSELTGLNDGTKYYYKINTFDSDNDEYEGTVLDFATLPRPRISAIQFQEVKGTAQPTVLVSWTTNTEISSIITYYPQGDTKSAKDEVNITLKQGEHKMVLQGLLPQTKYQMIVKGRDKIGNEALSDIQTFTTATDTRPPQITNLRIEGTTNSTTSGGASQEVYAQLVVSWDTDEPSTSQVEIGEGSGNTYAQKSQEDVNGTTNHIVITSNLTPSKVYHLRALSRDEVGNVGQSLDTVTITPKSTDSALDLVVGNLSEVFGFLGGLR